MTFSHQNILVKFYYFLKYILGYTNFSHIKLNFNFDMSQSPTKYKYMMNFLKTTQDSFNRIADARASPKYVKCPKKDSVIKVSLESDLQF